MNTQELIARIEKNQAAAITLHAEGDREALQYTLGYIGALLDIIKSDPTARAFWNLAWRTHNEMFDDLKGW